MASSRFVGAVLTFAAGTDVIIVEMRGRYNSSSGSQGGSALDAKH